MIETTNYWVVRLDKDLRQKVKIEALKNNRTVSNWVSKLVREALCEK